MKRLLAYGVLASYILSLCNPALQAMHHVPSYRFEDQKPGFFATLRSRTKSWWGMPEKQIIIPSVSKMVQAQQGKAAASQQVKPPSQAAPKKIKEKTHMFSSPSAFVKNVGWITATSAGQGIQAVAIEDGTEPDQLTGEQIARGVLRTPALVLPGQALAIGAAALSKSEFGADYVSWASPTIGKLTATAILAGCKDDKRYLPSQRAIAESLATDAVVGAATYYVTQKTADTWFDTDTWGTGTGWKSWLAGTAATVVGLGWALGVQPLITEWVRKHITRPIIGSFYKKKKKRPTRAMLEAALMHQHQLAAQQAQQQPPMQQPELPAAPRPTPQLQENKKLAGGAGKSTPVKMPVMGGVRATKK